MNNIYYETMSNDQKSRWISLLLAVDNISEYCNIKNIPFNDELLKPIAIKHFIQEKSKSIELDLDIEITNLARRDAVIDLNYLTSGDALYETTSLLDNIHP